ncbi:MAG: hypothetical protein RLZZ175_2893 [Bacteroidota bacterium]
MTNKHNIWVFIKKTFVRTTVSMSAFTFLLIFAIVIALVSPLIQNYALHRVTRLISEELNFPVQIKNIHISWLDEIVLDEVVIKDMQGNRMISVEKIDVDYKLFSIFINNTIEIENVTLDKASVKLVNHRYANTFNINQFIDALVSKMAKNKSKGKAPGFTIETVELRNSYFSAQDERFPLIDGFDHRHFGFDSVYAKISDFKIASDTFEINVKGLKCREIKTLIPVHQIDTKMRLTSHTMEFGKIKAKVGSSSVKDTLAFTFNSVNDMSNDFFNKVNFYTNLIDTKVSSKDLAYFAPALKPYNETWILNCEAKGHVTSFSVKNMDLKFGKKSQIKGNVAFNGLPDFFETFIEANISKANLDASDFKQYVSNKTAFEFIERIGKLKASGNFVGFPLDFVADGNFETNVGNVISDVNLKINENQDKSTYKGSVKTEKLDLKTLFQRPAFGTVDMDGDIEGIGFSLETAKVDLNAKISQIGINNYSYKNINTNAQFADKFFNGHIDIKDSNLVLSLDGEVDMQNNHDSIGVTGVIEKMDLNKLKIANLDLQLSSTIDLKIKGLKIDKMVGTANFLQTKVTYNNKSLSIDTLDLNSFKYGDQRSFVLVSEIMDLSAIGDFEFTQLVDDAQMFVKEYKLYFQHNDKNTQAYYKQKLKQHHNHYKVAYDLTLKKFNPFLSLILPGAYVSPNTNLRGNLANGEKSSFSVDGKIDKFGFKSVEFRDAFLDFSTSKSSDSTKVLAVGNFTANQQLLDGKPLIKDGVFQGYWVDNVINLKSSFSHATYPNHADLEGAITFIPNEMQLYLKRMDLTALDKFWQLQTESMIHFKGDDIIFDGLTLTNEAQFLSVVGEYSDNSNKAINFNIRNFNVNSLTSLTQGNYSGIANADLSIKKLKTGFQLQSNLDITDLIIENIKVGHIKGWSAWNNLTQKVNLDLDLQRDNFQVATIFGDYDPFNPEQALNLTIELNKTSLKLLETFLGEYVSNMQGEVTGAFSLKGALKKVDINGSAFVHLGGFKIKYLNTFYQFSDNVSITNNKIFVNRTKLIDENNNVAIVSGGLEHNYFTDFKINLNGDLNNFTVFDIYKNPDALYYGKSIVDGDMSIKGTFDDVYISGNFTSRKGTDVYIPLSWINYLQQKEFIKFTSKSQKQLLKEQGERPKVNLSGIKLNLNLDITPDADCSIILDAATGDVITGKGIGKLKLEIDTKGDFKMYGNYSFTEGKYHFTFLTVVSKIFEIRPGSNINWSGDAYAGIADISVYHLQNISLSTLSTNSDDSVKLKAAQPVYVNLNLKGEIMKPNITLGIDIKNPPYLDISLLEFKNKIQTNEQELNKQVFALLMLRQFWPEQSSGGGYASSATGKTLTELLSNQLNNWISQVDPNFQIDINLSGFSATDLNALKLKLQYQFGDKLRFSSDGARSNALGQYNTQSLLGDLTLEYQVTNSGNLSVKAFTKSNQSTLIGGGTSVNSTQQGGVSLLHSKSFDNLDELIKRKSKALQ